MSPYSSFADDFYVNMTLSTEMDLPSNRETVLHFFERMQKSYPTMRNFYCREKGSFVLEEDKGQGQYRWSTLDSRRICSGQVNPDTIEQVLDQHRLVLDLAPYMLSVSPLDCEALDLLYGFDFSYRGNHSQLLAEALGVSPAMERLVDHPGATVISHDPSITLSLDEDCRTQCRMSIEPRTNTYQIRTGEYSEEQLSVYISARHYGSLGADLSYVDALNNLSKICEEMVENYLIDHVLRPLARTIAMR